MFPPRIWEDIEGYDQSEVVEGYCSYRKGDPKPGDNHSDGYRWGWQNGYYDHNHDEDDGFRGLRFAYIRESGHWRKTPTGLEMVVPS